MLGRSKDAKKVKDVVMSLLADAEISLRGEESADKQQAFI